MDILVIDDQEEICEFLRDLLELHGCGVTSAYSGEEAVEKTSEILFDAAFIDICLPGIPRSPISLEPHPLWLARLRISPSESTWCARRFALR